MLRSVNVELNTQHFIKRARRLGSSKTVEITCSSTHLRSQTIRVKHSFLAKGLAVDVALTQIQRKQRKASMPTFVELEKTTLRPIWHFERIYVHVGGQQMPFSPALLDQLHAAAPSSSPPPFPSKPPSPPTKHTDSPAATPQPPATEALPVSPAPAPTPAAQDVQQHATVPVATLQTTLESTSLTDFAAPLAGSAPPPANAPPPAAPSAQDATEPSVATLQTTRGPALTREVAKPDTSPATTLEPPSPATTSHSGDNAGWTLAPQRKRRMPRGPSADVSPPATKPVSNGSKRAKPRGPSADVSPTIPKRSNYDSSKRPTTVEAWGDIWTVLPQEHDRRNDATGSWCCRVYNADWHLRLWCDMNGAHPAFGMRLGGCFALIPKNAVWMHHHLEAAWEASRQPGST